MKKYKFDYMDEMVSKWNPDIINIDTVSLNFGKETHYFSGGSSQYGETIEDFNEWIKQREYYCKQLVKKYKKYEKK